MTSYHPSLLTSKTDGTVIHLSKVLYENRYCSLDEFSVLVYGGYTENNEALNDVYELKGPNFECSKFPSMLEARYYCETAVINSDIVVVGGYNNDDKNLFSVELFKRNQNKWFHKTELSDKKEYFCVCSFKQNLYIIGGYNNG